MKEIKSIVIAADHAGFKLKSEISKHLKLSKYFLVDLGTNNEEPVDYPDIAENLANYLKNNNEYYGILICGSGIGMSIAINRYPYIRAALCRNINDAKMARLHNNVNVVSIGSKFTKIQKAIKIIDKFLSTNFEGGRHEKRVQKLGRK